MPLIRPNHKVLAAAALCAAVLAPSARAQEGVLHGLGWVTTRPGTEVNSGTSILINGNRSQALVSASGGKASVGLGIGAYVDLIATAQSNTVGLDALTVQNTLFNVLQNQLTGFVTATGGAATANTLLISGGEGRRSLSDSRFDIQNNKAGRIDALGAKSAVLLGLGSLQLPGRASGNSVLINDSDVSNAQVSLTDNSAEDLKSIGGSALANAMTVARSNLRDLNLTQTRNTARNVSAGGASGGVGWGLVASIELAGVAAANSFTAATSDVFGARLLQQDNDVDGMWAPGGSALANSVNLADYRGGSLAQYQALLSNNRAKSVDAGGGSGTILKGALADVRKDASALANSVSIQGGVVGGATRHALTENIATGVQAIGGAAAANSVWLQESTVQTSNITISNNSATSVDTAGGSATLGGGIVGSFERNGRALANSVALDSKATLAQTPVDIATNTARNVQGAGGLAAANSVLLSNSSVKNGTVRIGSNTADGVRATGFKGSVGGGLLFSTEQSAMALANTLGVFGSSVDPASISISDNIARELAAQGGMLVANSVSVEQGAGAGSKVAATVSIADNHSINVSTGAGSTAGPAHVFSKGSAARAATNSLVLHDDAQLDAGSPVALSGNRTNRISAIGGTALVNTLAGYRGARIEGSPITMTDNIADDVSSGGGHGQVAGVGKAKNGIVVANGSYLEGDGGVRLSNSPGTWFGNVAKVITGDGGRINANALAVNDKGDISASSFLFQRNRAESVSSEGSENTVGGHVPFGRGVGHASANSVQILGALGRGTFQLQDNTATGVHAKKGVALANSAVFGDEGSADTVTATLTDNVATNVAAEDGKTAAANSFYNEGRASEAQLTFSNNRGGATANGEDASASSVRNRSSGTLAKSSITLSRNQGDATKGGAINSVENDNLISSSQIMVEGNRGKAEGGSANSVRNRGEIKSSQIRILGNQGTTQGGGLVNSLENDGRITSNTIMISGNIGSARGGGTVNSVKNRGSGTLAGANISITNNRGDALGGGTVNSVDNHGEITATADIRIVGNQGSAIGGGTVNSVVNHGKLSGKVLIAGNRGSATAGGVANSVINRGEIGATGKVMIIGNQSAAGPVMTMGSARVSRGGSLAGTAGVAANVPSAVNAGPTVPMPATGIINNSVTVGPALTVLNM